MKGWVNLSDCRFHTEMVHSPTKTGWTVLTFAYFGHANKYGNEPQTILKHFQNNSELFHCFISVSLVSCVFQFYFSCADVKYSRNVFNSANNISKCDEAAIASSLPGWRRWQLFVQSPVGHFPDDKTNEIVAAKRAWHNLCDLWTPSDSCRWFIKRLDRPLYMNLSWQP